MNILELNFERTWRGGERQTLYNMAGFKDAGISVSLLCRKGYPLEEKAKAAGFTVFAFRNIFGVLFFLAFRCRKYAVFHAQTSHILTWCLITKPFHGAKIIFTRRVDFVPHGWLTKIKYRLADKIIGVSSAVKIIVKRFCGKEVLVIPDIATEKKLNTERAVRVLKEMGVAPGVSVLGTIAALVPHKDPLNMAEAIKILAAKRNDFVFLHFGNGELETEVKNRIAEYGLQDIYKMMGFYEDVEDFFSVLNVFVMSSQEEGLGSSVLDAFLYKTPVVATNAGGLNDLLQDGRGIICPKKNAAKLAEGIALLMDHPQTGTSNAERAYNYATAYHSLQYVTQQYLAVIQP